MWILIYFFYYIIDNIKYNIKLQIFNIKFFENKFDNIINILKNNIL